MKLYRIWLVIPKSYFMSGWNRYLLINERKLGQICSLLWRRRIWGNDNLPGKWKEKNAKPTNWAQSKECMKCAYSDHCKTVQKIPFGWYSLPRATFWQKHKMSVMWNSSSEYLKTHDNLWRNSHDLCKSTKARIGCVFANTYTILKFTEEAHMHAHMRRHYLFGVCFSVLPWRWLHRKWGSDQQDGNATLVMITLIKPQSCVELVMNTRRRKRTVSATHTFS